MLPLRGLPLVTPAHSMKRPAVLTPSPRKKYQPSNKPEQSASAAVAPPGWRLELFFKSAAELSSQLPFLRQHGLLRLNITNKTADDDQLGTVSALIASLSPTQQQQQQQQGQHRAPPGSSSSRTAAATGLDICVHYSLKYNYDKTPERSLQKLLAFCSDLQRLHHQAQKARPPSSGDASSSSSSSSSTLPVTLHVLLVSGGGKKKRFETVSALQALQQHHHQQQQQQQANTALQLPSLAVAFNPYLPSEADAVEERRRLRAKLETGLVDRVYLQMGTDLQRLQSGLEHLNQLVQQLSAGQPGFRHPELLGSVFLPSKRLLAQMKFRPWNGVFLSEEYLSSVEAAEAITAELLRAYTAAQVVPILESAVKTDDELQRAQALLGVGQKG